MMPGSSAFDWLKEQEKRRSPSVFTLEWIFVFALAGLFWTGVLSMLEGVRPSNALVIAVAAFYASATVYVRLFNVTRCQKCRSPLPLLREELDRRYVRDRESCVELEFGGPAFGRHLLQLYSRRLRVESVRCRCRRCRGIWQEIEEVPVSDYELVRTIDLDK